MTLQSDMALGQLENTSVNSRQVGGTHYQKLNPAPWDVITAWGLGYLDGTALKYISRWRHKNGVEDIKKAIHFLQKLLEEQNSPEVWKEDLKAWQNTIHQMELFNNDNSK